MTEKGPLLSVRDLRVSLRGRTLASLPELELGAGECVSLVGESGSGKTTSLMTVLGLNRGSGLDCEGSISLFGIDPLTASEGRLRGIRGRRVSLIMQSPQSALNPTLKLGALLMRVLAAHGIGKSDARTRMGEAFASVRLADDLADRYPHQVSGGQAQRFAIALALALGSEMIAADEPTSALDMTVQAEITALLQELCRDRGLGLLLVSHDLALVSTLADRVVVMKDGEVVDSADTVRVLTRPSSSYTVELINAGLSLGGGA